MIVSELYILLFRLKETTEENIFLFSGGWSVFVVEEGGGLSDVQVVIERVRFLHLIEELVNQLEE